MDINVYANKPSIEIMYADGTKETIKTKKSYVIPTIVKALWRDNRSSLCYVWIKTKDNVKYSTSSSQNDICSNVLFTELSDDRLIF